MLVSLTSGEALTIIRTVVDMGGFLAWRALHKRYSPVTPARTLAALMEVMCPPRNIDITVLPKAIDVWMLKLTTLEKGVQREAIQHDEDRDPPVYDAAGHTGPDVPERRCNEDL